MSYSGMAEDDVAVIRKAARLIAGKWDETVEQVLCGMFLETASHSNRAGVNAHANWCASMLALGKVCVAVSEREKGVHKDRG